MAKKEIFISYKNEEYDIQVVERLIEYLEKNGKTCFYAPRDIEKGQTYANELVNAMKDCKHAIIVCSRAAYQSVHMLNEIDILLNHQKQMIPFVIEDCPMSNEFLYYLGRRQMVMATNHDAEEHFGELMDALGYIPKEGVGVAPIKRTSTVFDYDEDRGVMINPADHQRNVSFRDDTLMSIFDTIYQAVADEIDEETAEEIFFNAGKKAGENFGKRLKDQWKSEDYSIEDKVNRWCAFDSAVGWGKFTAKDIVVDDENDTFSGKLEISENFIVDEDDEEDESKICRFVQGYCSGVLKKIATSKVCLVCDDCPKKKITSNVCKFHFSNSKGDK